MELEVFIEKEQITKKVSLKDNSVKDLLKELNINQETVLVTRNNEVLTEDEILNNNDKIEILSVISGG